jgi:hypothetical protein
VLALPHGLWIRAADQALSNCLLLILSTKLPQNGADEDPSAKRFRSLSGRRDRAELLHHAQFVRARPVFHDLATGNAVNADPRDFHLLAGRGYAHPLTRVLEAPCPAGHNLVPFGDHIFVREMRVGEGSAPAKKSPPTESLIWSGSAADQGCASVDDYTISWIKEDYNRRFCGFTIHKAVACWG